MQLFVAFGKEVNKGTSYEKTDQEKNGKNDVVLHDT